MKEQKIIYYSDELKDEFSNVKRNTKKIGSDYKYINKNVLWNICAFLVYYAVFAFAVFYCKFKFSLKVKNRKILKPYRKHGFYMYGNHTQVIADVFIPSFVSFPKKPYFIANPDNVSKKSTEQIILMLGAIPLPSTLGARKNFLAAVDTRINKGSCIQIYPEAHIWPYYTDIRPFGSESFRFPAMTDLPAFCFTNIYVKRRFSKKPKIITYVDGPFFSKENSIKEKQEDLKEQVYQTMKKRALLSDCQYIKYIKRT